MTNVHYGVSLMLEFRKVQFSELGFFICINDLTKILQSNQKLFADDTSLFRMINDPTATAKQLFEDLDKVKTWIFHWKMSFNSEPYKQVQEVIFTCNVKKITPAPIYFLMTN